MRQYRFDSGPRNKQVTAMLSARAKSPFRKVKGWSEPSRDKRWGVGSWVGEEKQLDQAPSSSGYWSD